MPGSKRLQIIHRNFVSVEKALQSELTLIHAISQLYDSYQKFQKTEKAEPPFRALHILNDNLEYYMDE